MERDAFSQVDFAHPEVRRCLARAYAVVLRIPKPQMQTTEQAEAEPRQEPAPQQQRDEKVAEQATRYVQERMF